MKKGIEFLDNAEIPALNNPYVAIGLYPSVNLFLKKVCQKK